GRSTIFKLSLAQIPQPVADLRRLFEFHILCGGAHIDLELADRFPELFRRILFKLVDLERNLEVIRLVSRYKRGLYGLYDRLWSNAVLDVIGFLDLAAASRFIHRIPH